MNYLFVDVIIKYFNNRKLVKLIVGNIVGVGLVVIYMDVFYYVGKLLLYKNVF